VSRQTLQEILSPPFEPILTGSPQQWREFEERVGVLPSDYKHFVSTYGFGAIADEICVLNPFVGPLSAYSLERQLNRQHETYTLFVTKGYTVSMLDDTGYLGEEQMPAGLCPWGVDQSGTTALWETTDPDPDRWTMYIFDGHEATRFQQGMSTFIEVSLRGRDTPMFSIEWLRPVKYRAWPAHPGP
jgi:hypothetical protein